MRGLEILSLNNREVVDICLYFIPKKYANFAYILFRRQEYICMLST